MSATIAAPPDHVAAIIARLRSFPELLALCADDRDGTKRIGGQMRALPGDPARWTGHALIVQDAGGFGPDPSVPLDTPRIDVLAYGKTGLEASRAARLALGALVPATRVAQAFTAAGCRIIDIRRVSGLLPLYDREIGVHIRAISFEVLKSEVTP